MMHPKFLAGLVAMALLGHTMTLPATAAEFVLSQSERDPIFLLAEVPQVLVLEKPIMLGATPVNVSQTSDSEWKDLEIPPDPEAATKMSQGHMREHMSLAHLLLGGATLGLLSVAGVSGYMLVGRNDPALRWVHQASVASGTLAYLADGALMVFAPRPHKAPGEKDFSNIEAHRYLFYLHLAGMTSAVITGLIATRAWGLDPTLDLRKSHPGVGAAAIGLIGVSATVMALNF